LLKATPTATATNTVVATGSLTKTATPAQATLASPSPTATLYTSFVGYVTATDGLRLRQGPSLDAAIISLMPFASEVTIDGQSDSWYHCIYGSQTGYCHKDYISKENPTANWVTYTNSTYGFSIRLPWSDYTTDTHTYPGITEDVRFWVPTADSGWPEHPRYNIFVVTVCTKAEWNIIKASDGPKPSYLGENANWVFAFSQSQATPSDATNKISLIPQIRATFRVL
jgi:hypothetical protein